MAQDPGPGSRARAVKTNALPLFKQSPGEPCPTCASRKPPQVLQPCGVTRGPAAPALGDSRKNTARSKLVLTSAFLVSGSGEFHGANTSGSHFEEERRVSEASVFQALQKRSTLHICTNIPAAYVSHFLEDLDEQEIRL